MTVQMVYCEGWDAAGASVVRPLPQAIARERDAAGDQYAILLTGDRPLAMVEVCWAASHAAAWRFDEQGRRDRCLEFRRWPDRRLRLRAARQWAYGPDSSEFLVDEPSWRAAYWWATYDRNGDSCVSSVGWSGPVPEFETSWPAPAFGEWSAVIGELLGEPVTAQLVADPHPVADPPRVAPWRPPVPLRPSNVDEAFEPGARFVIDAGEVTVELVHGGELALPSGRLVVADPDPWMAEATRFAEVVAPGAYPVVVSVVRFADDPGHARVAAVAVEVSGSPTVSWDTAWRVGEEELLLGDGQFFGVGVDGGRVGLVDESAVAAHAESIEEHVEDHVEDHDDDHDDEQGLVRDIPGPRPDGANLVTVESGWGDGAYPVWVGRDAGGRVTRFVVDFLLLAQARQLD